MECAAGKPHVNQHVVFLCHSVAPCVAPYCSNSSSSSQCIIFYTSGLDTEQMVRCFSIDCLCSERLVLISHFRVKVSQKFIIFDERSWWRCLAVLGCSQWVTGRVQTVQDAAPEGRFSAERREPHYVRVLKVCGPESVSRRTGSFQRIFVNVQQRSLNLSSEVTRCSTTFEY